MPNSLRAWKETLIDLGVMGLVPEQLPKACSLASNSQAVPLQTENISGSAPVVQRKAGTKKNGSEIEVNIWKAPTDQIKNPSPQSIKECLNLDALNECICRCEACPLGAGRIKFVFGEGSQNARMMFIGEGPGSDEDILGRPFVGRAGALLDKMIVALKMARSDVYIANIVKCRPPDNRTPHATESQTCLRYLERQMELIKPVVLVGLGATPLRELIGIPSGITKIRGTWQAARVGDMEIPYMPTFHPAYLLRNYTKEARQAVWEDLQAAQKRAYELAT
ncbi:MAG: uracil-DNA glycosylase [Holophagaceae bacterium]|jgi:DNA polymerase|nr:uracil-DNA glycosylase [Holophagaceae bacterium]